jgi:UDP-glucose 4-epimerase
VHTNWASISELERICENIDIVIHTAGMNSQDCAADPTAALEFNGAATSRLVTAAIHSNVRRFIYLSTAHVYCSPLQGKITEATTPQNIHPYATSHLAGECSVLKANQNRLLEGIVIRMSNAFGAPVHKDVNCWELLINDLCKQAVQTQTLRVKSRGNQTRDFVGLGEICVAIERIALIQFQAQQPAIINLGAGISHTILSIAELIQHRSTALLGFEPELRIPADSKQDERKFLSYQSDHLPALGIEIKGIANISEIDSLLQFCEYNFNIF